MKKIIFFFAILFLIVFVCAEVQYPVAELGNCADEQACKAYCDIVDNMDTCLDVAEETGLMTAREVIEARKFLPFLKSGETPGGCKTPGECDAYCDDKANLNECVDFAVKVGMISEEEAEMIKLTGGEGPGGCNSKEECDTYCEDETNLNECIDFAVQHGMISAEEAEMVKKTGGKGPGGCKGKEECDAFCQQKENFEICVDFAVQNRMMSAEEAEMVKKSGGESPGGCKGQEECDAFCNSEEGREVCMEFSYEHGMISEEEYQKMKEGGEQGMWTGPGGCTNEEECRAYCESGHQQECMDDALEHGYMTQEEYDQQMENWRRGQEAQGDENMPGDQPGGEGPGDYYVPPTEGEAPEGRGEMPGDQYVPPVEAPSGDMGSGGEAPGDESASSGNAGSYEPPSSGGEAPVTGGTVREIKTEDNFLIRFFKNLFR